MGTDTLFDFIPFFPIIFRWIQVPLEYFSKGYSHLSIGGSGQKVAIVIAGHSWLAEEQNTCDGTSMTLEHKHLTAKLKTNIFNSEKM